MSPELQSWLAPGIVLLTLAVFVWRALRRKKSGACGGSCGCPSKTTAGSLQQPRAAKR